MSYASSAIILAIQVPSSEPKAIIGATYTWAPGPDWLALQERWPSEEVDVEVNMPTYNRLSERGLKLEEQKR